MDIWKAGPNQKVRCMDRSVFMDALIERLYAELADRGCSLKELAVDCELCYEEISQILRRKKKAIRLDTMFKISRGLGMRASELLAEMEGGA